MTTTTATTTRPIPTIDGVDPHVVTFLVATADRQAYDTAHATFAVWLAESIDSGEQTGPSVVSMVKRGLAAVPGAKGALAPSSPTTVGVMANVGRILSLSDDAPTDPAAYGCKPETFDGPSQATKALLDRIGKLTHVSRKADKIRAIIDDAECVADALKALVTLSRTRPPRPEGHKGKATPDAASDDAPSADDATTDDAPDAPSGDVTTRTVAERLVMIDGLVQPLLARPDEEWDADAYAVAVMLLRSLAERVGVDVVEPEPEPTPEPVKATRRTRKARA